ncbi:MAG: hypothetical protein LC799_32155 [Actinobacteria bacterium]|nr:hypothetical protein [Actinomycetota bacterium]
MARIQNAIDAGGVEDIQEWITREKLQVVAAGKWSGCSASTFSERDGA